MKRYQVIREDGKGTEVMGVFDDEDAAKRKFRTVTRNIPIGVRWSVRDRQTRQTLAEEGH